MKSIFDIPILLIFCTLMTMCTSSIPKDAKTLSSQPKIEPDYTNLDIPVNISPLNFSIDEKGEDYITRFYNAKGNELVVSGRTLDINIDRWHKILKDTEGDTLYADVYVKSSGKWDKYEPIRYYIAEEIDPYISYRHIEPLYVNYEVLRICQRNLENFEINDIYNNCPFLNVEGDRQCMNCHSYQNYNKDGNMQMHIRVINPGTIIVKDGDIRKIDLKTGDLSSTGAYPSWHPTLPYIAYSINDTWQHFHSVDNNKVEVQDRKSGLILYNVDTNTVSLISDSDTELETFPYWSSDGKSLYYVSAKVPKMTLEEMANYRMNHYKDIKYNLYKRSFDVSTGTFGPVDTVYMASEDGKSVTFPRETPNGKYLLMTLGEYGTFHNFHHDADLYLMDLSDGLMRPLDEINSSDTESYHSWSSNGHWIIFSSRRDTGSYTRLYLAHFDGNGNASKPFILPEKSPSSDGLLFRSYNVPEFMVKPVSVSRQDLVEAVEQPAVKAKYKK